jgi:hypothetical protein
MSKRSVNGKMSIVPRPMRPAGIQFGAVIPLLGIVLTFACAEGDSTTDAVLDGHADGGADAATDASAPSPPPPQASCATALPVSDGTSLPSESLDLVSTDTSTCAGPTHALFYAVTVPPGARAHLRAQPVAGASTWTPKIVLSAGCSDGLCLASDAAATNEAREVTWTNSGTTPTTVIAAIAATAPVAGARFRLDVSVSEVPNTSCAAARPLTDGLVLSNQDANKAPTLPADLCHPVEGSVLFYSVRLLGKQTLTLDFLSEIPPGRIALFIGVRESCMETGCRRLAARPTENRITNDSNETKTLIVQVAATGTPAQRVFSFKASLSLPPGEVVVAPPAELLTDERGATGSFTVALGSPPLAPVTIPLRSSDPGEATVASSLAFDADNWFIPQTVVVKGENDDLRDGRQRFTIHVEPAVSNDPRYAGKDGPDVNGVNDDDEPHIKVEGPPILTTSEGGATATFDVALSEAPASPVSFTVSSKDPSEGTATPAELRFDANNWNVPQTVTVTGVDDVERDGPVTYPIAVGPAASADLRFNAIVVTSPVVRNIDDEWQAVAAQDLVAGTACEASHMSPIAVDRAGIVYVIYTCSERLPTGVSGSGAYATVSHDGGRTFSPRVRLGNFWGTNHVVGGVGGNAIAIIDNRDGVSSRIVRTVDGGATWTWGAQVPIQNENIITTVVSGRRVALSGIDNNLDFQFWSSADGGSSFTSYDHTNIAGLGLDFDSDGALWLASGDGRMRKSVDGGATFDAGIPTASEGALWIRRGKNRVFYRDRRTNTLRTFALQTPSVSELIPGALSPERPVLRFEITPNDGLVLVQISDTNPAIQELRWMAPGTTTLTPPRLVTMSNALTRVAPLSDTAAVVMSKHDTEIWASVEMRP